MQNPMRGKLVLYVDDDVDDQEIFSEVLNQSNPACRCLTARDAMEALALLKQSSSTLEAIFIDVNMPGVRGLQFLENIRVNLKYDTIPVVIISTFLSLSTHQHANRLNAKAFIQKPGDVREYVKAISACLQSINR
jgi:CheY-like chemotaxis protein